MERTTKSYADLLKDPRWQKKRLKIFQRDDFTCQMCKSKENTLAVHHKKYIKGKLPWEYDGKDLITFCEDCHDFVSNHGVEDTHHLISKQKIDSSTFYIFAWPWDITIYERSERGEVKCLLHFTDTVLSGILDYLKAWQEDIHKNKK